MRRLLIGFCVIALVACSSYVAEFWRPISEPNLLLPLEKAQLKLDFDLSQCKCAVYPTNVPQPDQISFQTDKQRLVQTGVTVTSDGGDCVLRPSLVVQECMRARGWEITKCSGRMPMPGGGALCATAKIDD
ncbi:MAG: hypothetical protein HGA90_05980 [Alphaproteobacteria bacterium]|nr:hypothetical protein [Alphaproteobacteria bacterium]